MVRAEAGKRLVGKRLLVDEGDQEQQRPTLAKIIKTSTDPTQPNKMLNFLITDRSSLKL